MRILHKYSALTLGLGCFRLPLLTQTGQTGWFGQRINDMINLILLHLFQDYELLYRVVLIIILQMANIIKEPSIKLIPSDPMTNTILIIYCVSSTGASVPYKSSWRRVHPKRNKVEDIKHHNASSYRCSPLDIDYFIEATVYYQHQNVQTSRIVQSNLVKVSR